MTSKNNDERTERINLVGESTGENYGSVPMGTKFQTPAEQERNRKYWQMVAANEEKKWRITKSKDKYGAFTWFFYKILKSCDLNIDPSNLTRLMFLSTYIDYNNILTFNKRPMTRLEMMEVLNISEREFIYFLNDVKEQGVLIYNDEKFIISESVFGKGKLPSVFISENIEERIYSIRLYQNTIRSLYNRATPRSHKTLSYLFQMIPYINQQYNILCFNPLEKDKDRIKPMLLNDYCTIIGYDNTHLQRLANNILKPSFSTANGTIETAVRIVVSVGQGGERIYQVFINPNVFYAGNVWEEVRILGKFG